MASWAVKCRTSGYARIIGSLSMSSGAPSINIYHMEPLSSFNSVTLHFLDVIRSYLYYQTAGNVASLALSDR